MTHEEIITGNKLIAELMGRCGKVNVNLYWVNVPGVKWVTVDQMLFHSSWDWLIPVIDRIYSMNLYYEYVNATSSLVGGGGFTINTKFISVTFSDVVELIKWYNSKK